MNKSTFGVVFEHVEHQNCLLYQLTEVYLYQSGNPSNYFGSFSSKYVPGKVETIANMVEEATFNVIKTIALRTARLSPGLSEEL